MPTLMHNPSLQTPPRFEISAADLDRLGFLKLAEYAVKSHGPVVTLVLPRAGREMTLLSAAHHVRFWQDHEDLFVKDHDGSGSGGAAMRQVLGLTLQTADGQTEWADLRKQMNGLLGSSKAWFQRPLEAASLTLIADLADQSPTPLAISCLKWATRAICDPLFNSADLEDVALDLLDCLDRNFYQRMGSLPTDNSPAEIQARINVAMGKVVQGCGPHSITQSLIDSAGGADPLDNWMRQIVAGILAASVHMNAMTLLWALVHLADDPDLQARINAESLAFGMGPRRVSDTPLAFAVLRESQRIKPITAFVERRLAGAVTLDGFSLGAGQTVLFSPWMVHRDPRNWEAPARFDPNRFLHKPPPARGIYLPFGLGKRICPGANIVNQQLTFAISAICQHLSLSRAATTLPGNLTPMFKLMLEPRGDVRLETAFLSQRQGD